MRSNGKLTQEDKARLAVNAATAFVADNGGCVAEYIEGSAVEDAEASAGLVLYKATVKAALAPVRERAKRAGSRAVLSILTRHDSPRKRKGNGTDVPASLTDAQTELTA